MCIRWVTGNVIGKVQYCSEIGPDLKSFVQVSVTIVSENYCEFVILLIRKRLGEVPQ